MRDRKDAPYLRGQAAACIALGLSDNPFPLNSAEFIEWLRGYREWEREWAARGQAARPRRLGVKPRGLDLPKLSNGE